MNRIASFAAIATLVACGGRTDLTDLSGDAASTTDSSIIGNDGGVIVGDGGIIFDSGPQPEDGGIITLDAGPPSLPIQCGQSTCQSDTEVCCLTFNQNQGSATCTPIGQCQGVNFSCSSAQSCPNNEVCCGTFTQQSASAQCEPTCPPNGPGSFQLCTSNAECPNGLKCKNAFIPGYRVCRP